jgi:hypothetical protein
MRPSSPASLLVAALMLLRQPCTRSHAAAALLLARAAQHPVLTPAEREACSALVDDLDGDAVPRAHGLPFALAA